MKPIKLFLCGLLCPLLLVGCGQKTKTVPAEVVYTFADSVSIDYGTGVLTFTIPETIPEGCGFSLLVGAWIAMGEGGMSLHPFEEQEPDQWEPGGTYTHTFGEDTLLDAVLEATLTQDDKAAARVQIELENGGRGQIHTFFLADSQGNLVEDEVKTHIIYD